jgi:tripartite-type tricarboxylate transporter receptor subunit TctC
MPQTISRRSLLTHLLACVCSPAFAQAAVRLRTLTLVLPTPPGSQPDIIARWLIEPMAQAAGVPGIVVNRPGGAGAIAVDSVMNSLPESGSLLMGGLDHVAYSHLNSTRKPLDPTVDVIPVGAVNRDSWLVVASRDGPLVDLRNLRSASRAQALSYGTTGEGSTAHLLSARLCRSLRIDAQHVPYKESFIPDLVTSRIDFAVAPAAAVMRQVKGDQLRALASLTSTRLERLPDVATIAELGWPDQVFHGGLFLFAPAQLAPMAAQINQWLVSALQKPEIIDRYREAEIQPTPADLRETRQMISERLQLVDAMRIAVFGRAR